MLSLIASDRLALIIDEAREWYREHLCDDHITATHRFVEALVAAGREIDSLRNAPPSAAFAGDRSIFERTGMAPGEAKDALKEIDRLTSLIERKDAEIERLRSSRHISLAEAVREVEASNNGETVWVEADLTQIRGLVRERNNLARENERLREIIDGPQLAPPLVIEDQGGASTEWVISFAGLHPSDKECVTVHDGPTALKLASLVRRLVASRERSLQEIIRQHEERGGDE